MLLVVVTDTDYIPCPVLINFSKPTTFYAYLFLNSNIDGVSINDIPRKIYAELGEQEQINEQ